MTERKTEQNTVPNLTKGEKNIKKPQGQGLKEKTNFKYLVTEALAPVSTNAS